MQLHIARLPRHGRLQSALLVAFLVSAGVASAIVKQQPAAAAAQQSQQQRSDESSSVYNHQHVGSPQQQSISIQSNGANVGSQNQNSPQQQQQQQQSSYGPASQAVGSQASPASGQQASVSGGSQKPSYTDSMAAAASNPEQSYQAAAQTVNAALANSGIFGGSSGGAYSQQQQQGASQQQQGAASGASSLNPLHYFYYPAAKESAAGSGAKPTDMMANSASSQYQSMAGYPTYADQYSAGPPDVAASSQDPSYLPQPIDQMNQQQQQQPSAQQQGVYSQQPQHQAQQPAQPQGYGGDLAGYASQPIPQQQPAGPQMGSSSQQQGSSISFTGPSSGAQNGAPQDYLNQQPGMGQVQQPQPSYQQQGTNNLFSQLAAGGDLSTSNFGNNAGGLSSIASYMSPNSQLGGAQQNQAGGHQDLFSALAAGGNGSPGHHQFNQAASQLSAAIAPPQQQQQQQQQHQNQMSAQQQGSALFGATGNSLFGGSSQQQQAQGQQQGLFGGALGNSYLNSFLSPQQYSQLTGQQMSAMASEQSPLSLASAIGAQQQAQQQQAAVASAQAASSIASGSSGKRFGLGSFIMPMLALAGLSLLIPTMSNIGTAVGRKKRSIVEEKASASSRAQQIVHDSMNGAQQLLKESSLGEYLDRIERYYAIYKNAVESDDCLNRLICEFGEVARDYTGKSVAMMSVVEKMVPQWMEHKMHLFREAAMNHKEGKEKCRKYVCHSGSRQH